MDFAPLIGGFPIDSVQIDVNYYINSWLERVKPDREGFILLTKCTLRAHPFQEDPVKL